MGVKAKIEATKFFEKQLAKVMRMTTKSKTYFEKLEATFGRLTFGDAIVALRQSDGISQKDFAKKLGLSTQNLCDIEKGRRIPSVSRAAKIANKCKIPEKAFIELSLRDTLAAAGLNYSVQVS